MQPGFYLRMGFKWQGCCPMRSERGAIVEVPGKLEAGGSSRADA
jgi:hypothetical protein